MVCVFPPLSPSGSHYTDQSSKPNTIIIRKKNRVWNKHLFIYFFFYPFSDAAFKKKKKIRLLLSAHCTLHPKNPKYIFKHINFGIPQHHHPLSLSLSSLSLSTNFLICEESRVFGTVNLHHHTGISTAFSSTSIIFSKVVSFSSLLHLLPLFWLSCSPTPFSPRTCMKFSLFLLFSRVLNGYPEKVKIFVIHFSWGINMMLLHGLMMMMVLVYDCVIEGQFVSSSYRNPPPFCSCLVNENDVREEILVLTSKVSLFISVFCKRNSFMVCNTCFFPFSFSSGKKNYLFFGYVLDKGDWILHILLVRGFFNFSRFDCLGIFKSMLCSDFFPLLVLNKGMWFLFSFIYPFRYLWYCNLPILIFVVLVLNWKMGRRGCFWYFWVTI